MTIADINALKDDLPSYIRYLLRLGAFETQADLARELGVTNERVRSIKFREAHK